MKRFALALLAGMLACMGAQPVLAGWDVTTVGTELATPPLPDAEIPMVLYTPNGGLGTVETTASSEACAVKAVASTTSGGAAITSGTVDLGTITIPTPFGTDSVGPIYETTPQASEPNVAVLGAAATCMVAPAVCVTEPGVCGGTMSSPDVPQVSASVCITVFALVAEASDPAVVYWYPQTGAICSPQAVALPSGQSVVTSAVVTLPATGSTFTGTLWGQQIGGLVYTGVFDADGELVPYSPATSAASCYGYRAACDNVVFG